MSDTKAPSVRRGRWGQERRLDFIDTRLYWEGRLNRTALTEFFGISVPQASLDLAEYQSRAPGNAIYDRNEKAYVALPDFKPAFIDGTSGRYLAELYALTSSVLRPDASFLSAVPTSDIVRHPTRQVSTALLRTVLRAIRNNSALEILYQTMTRPEPDRRIVSPHALAYDGYRWHIRAFCHTRRAFRDFVFARIIEHDGPLEWPAVQDEDIEWNTVLTVMLGPHPDLNQARRRVVELDYGMIEGKLEIKTRQSLAYYLLKRLGLDRPVSETAGHEQHVTLLNGEELARFIPALRPKE
ncbi:MAG: WYL domain-containing protein [Pseudoxanthomonas spadix]|nr:MAG: WYL domain-containing protein [Pseudoxanthomonas spadix]